jgi:hypothetical protein
VKDVTAPPISRKIGGTVQTSSIEIAREETPGEGFRTSEQTAATSSTDYGDPKNPVLSAIDDTEQKDKVTTTKKFNGGTLNPAGSVDMLSLL